ncbi:hypothetical protein N7493_005987 [Penicillium malachiteum]|uniref:Uncharacterized protein n=1 Tax=Penicillium malachiteum TaxID=1324776 RepID=A0AAD6MVY2_9EURO|nr:hypothetical protein N7493_005987 [Penicillium malachiteum]
MDHINLDHLGPMRSIINLTILYQDQDRQRDAEKLGLRAVATYKTNLASGYRSQGRLEEAKELQIQALENSKTKFGVYHPDTLETMSDLASTYWAQDQLEKAKQLQTHIWQTCKSQLGVNHHMTLISLNSLAWMYWHQGLWEKAQRFLVQIAETHKTNLKLGVDHLNMRMYVKMSNDMFRSPIWGLRKEPDQLNELIPGIQDLEHGNINSDTPGITVTGDTVDMTKFELCGIRNTQLMIPSLIPSSFYDKWTIIYLVSLPLPANVSALQFEVIGYDQGFSYCPRDDTSAWFEVSILGPWREIVDPNFANLDDPKHPKSCPGDFGGILQDQGFYFKDLPRKGSEGSIEAANISLSFAQNSTQKRWKHHSVLWSRADSNGDSEGARFLSVLEEGDRLAIWVRAKVQTPVSPFISETLLINLKFPGIN